MSISSLGFIDYKIPPFGDEDSWRIESGQRMLSDFDIMGSEDQKLEEVVRWHVALSKQPRIWEIVCRLFAVTPMYGVEDMDLMQPWTFETIAERHRIPVREVEAGFSEAKSFWRRWRSANAVVSSSARSEVDVDNLDEPTIEKLLLREGFVGVEAPEERRYIARRIVDLEPEFEGGQRSVARSLVEQEVNIFFTLAPALRALNKTIQERSGTALSSKDYEDRLTRMLKSRTDAQAAMESTMKALGISEAQTGGIQKRGAFKDCLATVVEAVAEYEGRGDRTLIDGVFAAAEIEVMTEDFRERSFQYRPDLPIIVPECIENLFDPNYSPMKIARAVHRRLLAGFKQGLSLARSEAGMPVAELDPESVEDRNDALATQAERDGDTAILTSGLARAVAKQAPSSAPPAVRKDRLADY